MDPIDILGSLLGGGSQGQGSGSGGGSLGGSILADILSGGKPKSTSSGQRTDIDSKSMELEDMLGVARDRANSGFQPHQPSAPSPSPYQRAPTPRYTQTSSEQRPVYPPSQAPTAPAAPAPAAPASLDKSDEALILIQAMVNAAKADGKLTDDEKQQILGQVSNASKDAVDFMKKEFQRPLDVREFAWSVPLGMEQQVYTMSLATIRLDTKLEANYLAELAHGLRLSGDTCNQIHQRYGAQQIF